MFALRSGTLRSLRSVALLSVLVLGACSVSEVDVSGGVPEGRIVAYQDMSRVALEQVEDLWGAEAVAGEVMVVLPGTAAEFAELTGGAPASQEAPAVTVGSGVDAHVVVHPDSWDRLTPEGRQAVLTHEVTHLAQQGDGPVPRWLGEGIAEYTAHRGSELPPETIAGSALDGVRDGAVLTEWPDLSTSDPRTSDPRTPAADAWGGYALSWLACVYIAQTWSEEQLMELYEEVSGGTALEEAIPQVLGVPEQEALTGWAQWLSTL